MSETLIEKMIEQAIKLEIKTSELYNLYAELFPQNGGFWKKLSEEEKNHAALLKTSELFVEYNLPDAEGPVLKNFDELSSINSLLVETLATFRESPPTESQACRIAAEFESNFQELHFQKTLDMSDTKISKIYRKLNHFDKDHEKRIRQFMKDRNY